VAKNEQEKVCFAVTPIGGEGSEIRRRSDQVLKYIIEPVMANLGYEVVRADRISQPGMITHQVVEHLIDDALVVADLTGSNPNVFYELGIRHATRKPIVTMIEAGERIPFDVNQSRTIQFTYKDLDSVDTCKSHLEDQVRALEANPVDFFTPVSVAVDLKSMHESGDPEDRRDAQLLTILQEVQAEMGNLGGEVARLSRRVEQPSTSRRANQRNVREREDVLEVMQRARLQELETMTAHLAQQNEDLQERLARFQDTEAQDGST
jgi:hypothetical protein